MTEPIRTGTLPATPPFDLARSLAFLGAFSPTGGEQTIGEGRGGAAPLLTKAMIVGGRAVAFSVEGAGSAEAPLLSYTLYADDPLSDEEEESARVRIGAYLSLDDDLQPFYERGREDEAFAPIIERLHGYHQVRFLSPFECAAWAVLTQRNPMPAARRTKRALAEWLGAAVEVSGTPHWAFPEPARVAEAGPEELSALVGNARRTEYLRATAWAFGDADDEWLRSAPYDEVEAWLRGITGIGAWSASFILLRGLGRMEHILVGDRRLLEAARRVYGRALTEAEMRRIADGYGPWQGYWAHYLRAVG